jgi:23S rRNA (adenine2503-C2)-methyltransferase
MVPRRNQNEGGWRSEDAAVVYIVSTRCVAGARSIQPPCQEEKWVLLISTMFGCPVGCAMCDAGGHYEGKVSAEQIFAQLDFLVTQRFPDRHIPSRQFKIQFARMGEPALNAALLEVLEVLPTRYHAPGLMPSLSTIAPASATPFFERLLEIKRRLYHSGHFQFQFSLHTTDQVLRDQIIPVKKWSFSQMAEYGRRFYQPGDRKITLNFALAEGNPLEPQILLEYFTPEKFLIKITPQPDLSPVKTGWLPTLIPPAG